MDFLYSQELLDAWYPDQPSHWVQEFSLWDVHELEWKELPFAPTHKVDIMCGKILLASDLIVLDPTEPNGVRYGYAPQASGHPSLHRIPLVCNQRDSWWSFVSPTWDWYQSTIYVRTAVRVNDTSHIGWVYFLLDTGTGSIKIGWSRNVSSRVAALQVANSSKLILLGTWPGPMEEEKRHHDLFQEYRQSGEWFSPGPRLVEYLKGKFPMAKELL